MMRQILLYIFIFFVCSVNAEQFRMTGKVVDAFNEPMIGGTVEVVGTDRRTATNIDGNFSIEVEKSQILKFSYVGYHSKEVEVSNDSSLVIELEEDKNYTLPPECKTVTGPSLCPCPRHSRERGEYNYFSPIESDSTKITPVPQNSVINH